VTLELDDVGDVGELGNLTATLLLLQVTMREAAGKRWVNH
jgi:hypothetical protein